MFTLSFRAALLTLAGVATPSLAQRQPVAAHRWTAPIEQGAIVRVRTQDSVVTQGRLLRQASSSLVVGRTDPRGLVYSDTTIQTSDIVSVDRRVGRRYPLQGLGIGAGAGVLAGLGVAAVLCAVNTPTVQGAEDYCGLGFIMFPPVLAATGGAIGLIAGAFRATTHWEPIAAAP